MIYAMINERKSLSPIYLRTNQYIFVVLFHHIEPLTMRWYSCCILRETFYILIFRTIYGTLADVRVRIRSSHVFGSKNNSRDVNTIRLAVMKAPHRLPILFHRVRRAHLAQTSIVAARACAIDSLRLQIQFQHSMGRTTSSQFSYVRRI